jgi:hypothetical protein
MTALLAGPLAKILGAVVAMAAVFGLGYWEGRAAIQEAWDAAVTRQAMDAVDTVIRAAENTARIEAEFQRQLDAHASKVQIVRKEVKVYVETPATKCVLTPEFERVFDAVSRVRDAGTDGLPAAGESPGAAVVPSDAVLTDATVLLAYEGAVVELFALWDTYSALRDWVRSSHVIETEGAGR